MVDVPSRAYQPIENYGVIGDLYTVALVGMDGSIDFCAFPHFDSPTVFGPSSMTTGVGGFSLWALVSQGRRDMGNPRWAARVSPFPCDVLDGP